MLKVVLELVKNALLLQYAHQTSNQVETYKQVETLNKEVKVLASYHQLELKRIQHLLR
jgi:hypothetical protein